MTTDTAPAIKFGDDWATPTIFTFEGYDIVIHFHPDVGSMARLADLCEIHQCGAPEDILPMLQQCGGGCYAPDQPADCAEDPAESLVDLDDHELMGTIHALSTDWNLAVRFRGWLVDRVFQSSPHRELDERTNAARAELNASSIAENNPRGVFPSVDEYRAECWAEELKRRRTIPAPPATKRVAPDDLLEQAITSGVISRLFDLLREVQERGQCSRQEAAAVIVATVQVIGAER